MPRIWSPKKSRNGLTYKFSRSRKSTKKSRHIGDFLIQYNSMNERHEIPTREADIAFVKNETLKLIERDDGPEIYHEITHFADGLRKRHPDWEQYELYHALISSTPHGPCEKHDFPGDDSVMKFIQELKTKYSSVDSGTGFDAPA